MPKIKTPYGVIKYKTVPLYPGVKRIDKDIAIENLRLLNEVFTSNSLKYQLAFGTALGIQRDKDFIDHDEDIDIQLLEEDRNRFYRLLPQLQENGFRICRYDRRGLISIIRKGEYIDLYFYRPYTEELYICSGSLMPYTFLRHTQLISFYGQYFPVPAPIEEYLNCIYGEDWKTPICYNDYDKPLWKIKLFELKEHFKDFLPGKIFLMLCRSAEQKMKEKTLLRYEKYKIRSLDGSKSI